MRNSARKQLQNKSTKSRLGTLQKKYSDLVAAGKKTEATATVRIPRQLLVLFVIV